MGTASMGKVLVKATIENLEDVMFVQNGLKRPEEVRRVEVDDALVDTGASTLSMPKRMIAQLGIRFFRTRQARTTAGTAQFQMYGPVRLTVQDRNCFCDVLELPDNCPVLIGLIPLEAMDWVVDPIHQRLIGNPDHNGEDMVDVF